MRISKLNKAIEEAEKECQTLLSDAKWQQCVKDMMVICRKFDSDKENRIAALTIMYVYLNEAARNFNKKET